MRPRTILTAALLLVIACSMALAADISGKYTGEVQGRNGPRPVSFTLKQDGDKLTGTMSGFQGRENPISDGKVDGDAISFTVTMEMQGNTMKTNYTGKVSGDEIKMKGQREGSDRTQEFTAKKAN